MEELLKSMVGSKIDVSCGAGSAFRGEVKEAGDKVLWLHAEDGTRYFIAIEKITAISEVSDNAARPGFIG